MKRRVVFAVSVAVVGAVALVTCQTRGPSKQALIPPAGTYDVRILRDTWGVPHIFGKTDADCAYGLAFAHAEDDFATIVETLVATRGQIASVKGKDEAPVDYMVHLLRVWEYVEAGYATDLSPEVRAICTAYADGLNHYAALHPGAVDRRFLPFRPQDVVAGFVFKAPFFFGLDGRVQELFGDTRRHPVSEKHSAAALDGFLTGGLPVGSNAFAVSPARSADGSTMLNINSHQPWTGPVAWYEAHLRSEEGMDIVGGVFPGTPIILHGHNRHLGWAHTVNRADLVDIYVLDINPDNPDQYLFDGAWHDLEVRHAPITVKLFGPLKWTVKREVLWSVYGPAVRQPHGVYAIRYAGMGNVQAIEQWYRMGKATHFDEWLEAMQLRGIPSFNACYADKEGNIYYLFNASLPLRAAGYDWSRYLPGNTSETLWTEYLPFADLPQVLNPESGFVQNCNNTPFMTTLGEGNPDPDRYDARLGIDDRVTNRALRALELLSADDSITWEAFKAYKFDMRYSDASDAAKAVQRLLAAPVPEDPLAVEALEVLRQWDLQTNPENTSAALAVLTIGPNADGNATGGDVDALMQLLVSNARTLKETHGRVDVAWGEVNRLYRGEVNLPVGGGPDVLHAVYGFRIRSGAVDGLEDGEIFGRAGDCYVLLVRWDAEGNVHSESIHQFGSATLDASSPHYADQAELFVQRQLKPVWFEEAEIRANLGREYRPGD
jgi:acyl-homoserine-lactone acylase